MKFTFLLNKRVGYKEIVDGEEQLMIADGLKWDYIFVENKDEHERLANLKDLWFKVFDSEKVTKKEVKKQEEKIKQVQKEEVGAETIEELRELYLEKTGKEKVPANKKNDEEWLRKKILEA